MPQRAARLATVIAVVLAVTASVLLTGGAAAKKKKQRLRPPTCEETKAVIQNTANQLAAGLAASGYSPDEVRGHNFGYTETCRLILPNKRRGSGRIVDYRPYNSDPNYQGLPFYEFGWYEVVTRTRKGTLTSTREGETCRYGVQTGTGIAGGRPC
jgi:hypothetical protein